MNRMRRLKYHVRSGFVGIVAALLIAIAPQALMARTANDSFNITEDGSTNSSANTKANSVPSNEQLAKEVRRTLLRLPYYGVFDNLAYSIDGSQVTLYGQVVRPSTSSDALRSVARIEGVTQVVNNIRVLPLSGFDDSIRVRSYRALARTGGLYRYFMGTNPSLHIVVDRGHVTLAGVVSNRMDKQLAYMTASGIPGVFSVTNDLQVEGENEAR